MVEIELGDQDGLLVPGRPGEDLPVGADDHGVAGLHPLESLGTGVPHAFPVGEVRGDLVDVQHTD